MKLTISKVKSFTKRALRDAGLDAQIESIEWAGQRSKERFGPNHFRVATVVLLATDGRRVYKSATIDTTNAFTIR